jgi:hypothetical protein
VRTNGPPSQPLAADGILSSAIRQLSEKITILLDQGTDWARQRRERLRNWGLAGALIIFVAGLVWTIRETPGLEPTISVWQLLLLLMLSAPAGTVLNTLELYALGRIAGGPMPMRTSLELTIYTSAANMLPLPGGVVTKLAGMKAHGSSYKAASVALVLSFVIWGGLAFLFSAAALLFLAQAKLAAIFAVLGTAMSLVATVGFARFGQWWAVAMVVATRLASLILETIRYVLALGLVGASISFVQASTFVVGSFAGATVVIAPHGLGVAEAATAFLTNSIGLSAGIGFMAAAVTRIARLAGLAVIAAVILVSGRRSGPVNDHSGSD